MTVDTVQRGWWRSKVLFTALVILLLAVAVADAVRQSHTKAIENPNDFVTLYAGSICVTHACNPYSVPELDSVLISRRGSTVRQEWADQLPIYPPTTLFVLLPFSALSYRAATGLWFLLSLGVYVFGLCWVSFRSPILEGVSWWARSVCALLGLHFPKMLQCLGFGNPAVMATGLLLFSVFDDGDRRRVLRIAAALLACFLKPPIAIPAAVVMLLRTTRNVREAARIAAICASIFTLLALCSFVPSGMAHWKRDLAADIRLGEQGGMNPSNRVSPSNVLLNVANIPGYFTTDPRVIESVALTTVAVLTIPFLVGLVRIENARSWDDRSYLTAVAAAGAVTLLPVYHRFCDIGVLLLVVPWILIELRMGARWQAWAALPILSALYVSWERRIHLEGIQGPARAPIEFLYYRGDAILVLALAAVLVSALLQTARAGARHPALATESA